MRTFKDINWGRIYVERERDLYDVKMMYGTLLATYQPDKNTSDVPCIARGLIVPYTEYPKVIPIHDEHRLMDIDFLVAACWSQGMRLWVFCAYSSSPLDLVAQAKRQGLYKQSN